jgi:hypothetical protein
MFVLILSWSIITGFKFWMIEPAFAPIGQAEIRVFIVFIFLSFGVAVVAADRLVTPIARFRFAWFATKGFGINLLAFWGKQPSAPAQWETRIDRPKAFAKIWVCHTVNRE